MRARLFILFALLALGTQGFGQVVSPPAAARPLQRIAAEQRQAWADLARLEQQHLRWSGDDELFTNAARGAWAFVRRHFEPATGFVTPLGSYRFTTMWDVGGMLAAIYSAHELGFIDRPEYERRVGRILETLTRVPLYDNRAFNKWYDARTGARIDRGYERPDQFSGWSATDLGRLLLWLKIVARDPMFADRAAAVVGRLAFDHIVRSGYLWGEDLDAGGRQRIFQEGRIGYEQYAALGFAAWGQRAERALDLEANALPVTVMGQPVLADFRRFDRLTMEPFVLWGLEVGWDRQTAALVRRLLLAQETRFDRTGIVTIASEDSVALPPHYFYYYCLYADGRQFALDVADRAAVVDGPRWVSAKAALGLHALLPGRYTSEAVRSVMRAETGSGWASGIYEGTSQSTGSISINTAAVILTAAVVHANGEPILGRADRLGGD
jgi:hypothetical protein